MKQTQSWMKWMGVGALALASIAGCSQSDQQNPSQADENRAAAADNVAEGAANVAGNADEVANNVATAAGNQAKGAANAVGNADEVAANVANAAGNQVKGAGNAVGRALNTGDVKTSLLANPAIKGSTINVTTQPGNRVVLTGTVKSQNAKNLATQIAKREASGYTVVNNLKVAGG